MADIKNRFSTFKRYISERLTKKFWKKYVHTNGTQKIKYVHTNGTKRQKNSHGTEIFFWVQKFLQKKIFKDILKNSIHIPKIVSEAIFDICHQKKYQGGQRNPSIFGGFGTF